MFRLACHRPSFRSALPLARMVRDDVRTCRCIFLSSLHAHAVILMSLESILADIEDGTWLSDTAALAGSGSLPLTKAESRVLQTTLSVAKTAMNVALSSNALCAAIITDTHRTEQLLRRDGVFRPSKNGFDSPFCRDVLTAVLADGVAIHLPASTREYLKTLRHLHTVGTEVRRIENGLVEVLADRGPPFFKRLFAAVELIFMADNCLVQVHGDRSKHSFDPLFWTREDLAEAFSYITHLVAKHFGTPNFNCPVDDRDDVDENAVCALVLACHVRQFHEWEALVDGLGYRVREIAPRRYSIESRDPTLERAIRLGFVQTEMRFAATAKRAVQGDTIVLRKAAEFISKKLGHRIIQRVKKPVDRLRFEFPSPLFTDKNLLACEGFFEEEVRALEHYSHEWMLDGNELLDFEVADRVRLRDLLRAQRIFQFVAHFAGRELIPRLERGLGDARVATLIHQSAIVSLPHEQLPMFLAGVLPDDRIGPVLEFLAWSPERSAVFDVQYRPLIRGERSYFIPMSIAAFSNIMRNAIKNASKPIDRNERFPSMLRRTLQRRTPDAVECVKYDFSGQKGELDTVARIGKTLFVFEVKASLQPVNAHELRTTWDHALRAGEQLDSFCSLYANPAFRAHLEQRLGFPLTGVNRLQTAIILANRMFAGYRIGDHPIRGAFELDSFVSVGTVSMGDEERNLWQGSELTEDDLVAFLDGDLTMQPAWDSMEVIEQSYLFGDINVVVPTFRLNMLRLAKEYGFEKAIRSMVAERESAEQNHPVSATNRVRGQDANRKDRRKRKRNERSRKKRGRR